MADAKTWRAMAGPEFDALRAHAAQTDPGDVAAVSRLRRLAPAEIVSAALELADARRRLKAKWPDRWDWMLADRAGAEMASSHAAAKHKAARFARAFPGGEVADLCCGIGADAIGLVEARLRVTGYDIDPARCWMCESNAQCDVELADVATETPAGAPFHLDPARRAVGTAPGARGRWHLADHAPSPAVWRKLLADGAPPGAAIKLGPGVEREQVVEALGAVATRLRSSLEIEYISESGRMIQAVAWLGVLAVGTPVSATLLTSGGAHTVSGISADPPGGGPGEFLLEADPSIERARLLHVLCERHDLTELHPGLGLLAGGGAPDSPWLTSFRVLGRSPFNAKRLRGALSELGAGIVEVKTRGGACDPDKLQAQLRGRGERSLTVFVLRLSTELVSFVCERSARGSDSTTYG